MSVGLLKEVFSLAGANIRGATTQLNIASPAHTRASSIPPRESSQNAATASAIAGQRATSARLRDAVKRAKNSTAKPNARMRRARISTG